MENLTDIQSQPDSRNLDIDRVGVKELKYPIRIRDKEKSEQSTVATVSMAVDLPKEYKGTHMSRFVEVLNSHGPFLDVHSIAQLPAEMLERLDAQRAHIELRFPFFLEKPAPVTKKVGMMDYEVIFDVDGSRDDTDFVVTVLVPVTTLCPCSKAISAYGAHNQRGVVTYAVRFSGEPIWIEDLVRLVERCASSELYSLLKRPDEKHVTEEAYDNPVFVEDLVRNVAAASEKQNGIAWYRVEAENFESIHNHNAYAVIEKKG
ncbi:MAG: GTP cyclohydrolase FolE2 [Verrucomicrobiales bacterium]|nr:GTP cyclohydrolase FolE2 [Verrucomicrobiales bacterium]